MCRVGAGIEVHAGNRIRIDDSRDRLEVLQVVGLVEAQAIEQEQHFVGFAAADVVLRRDAAARRAGQVIGQAHRFVRRDRQPRDEFLVEVGVR